MNDKYVILLAVYGAAITIIFAVMLIRKNKKHEKSFYRYQDKVMKTQLQEVNNLYMTMRGWRHDYHNHMQKIRAHLGMGQVEEARSYIDQMESELTGIDFKYKTGNISMDAILNSKLTLAEQEGILIKCDACAPEKLSINDVDICVIMGNLIDNAIEACDKINEQEKKFLRIYICVMKNQLYISVTNGTNEVIRRLDRDYITNKRGNHGHGLKRINDIVKKYNGYINRQNEPGAFATEILLPMTEGGFTN